MVPDGGLHLEIKELRKGGRGGEGGREGREGGREGREGGREGGREEGRIGGKSQLENSHPCKHTLLPASDEQENISLQFPTSSSSPLPTLCRLTCPGRQWRSSCCGGHS